MAFPWENPSPLVSLKRNDKSLTENEIWDKKFDLGTWVTVDMDSKLVGDSMLRLQGAVGKKYDIWEAYISHFKDLIATLGKNPNRVQLVSRLESLNKDCTSAQLQAMKKCLNTLGITNLSETVFDTGPKPVSDDWKKISTVDTGTGITQKNDPKKTTTTIEWAYAALWSRQNQIDRAVSFGKP